MKLLSVYSSVFILFICIKLAGYASPAGIPSDSATIPP